VDILCFLFYETIDTTFIIATMSANFDYSKPISLDEIKNQLFEGAKNVPDVFCISDTVVKTERVNFTNIAIIVQRSACDDKASYQMRKGFESYIEHYSREEAPYILDVDGDYWVWPDVAMFIIDHVTPTFEIVAIKRRLSGGEVIANPFHRKAVVALSRYIATGVMRNDDPNKHNHSVTGDVKYISEIVTQLIGNISRMCRSMNLL
jgi:hypothetical protein